MTTVLPVHAMLSFCVIVQGENAAGLPATFDEASAALALLPRLFLEPDGSFVWRGELADKTVWQVDGNLIDQGQHLAYVELSGRCPSEQFDQLLSAIGWPNVRLAFQLPRQGTVLSEEEFRRRAAEQAGAR